MIKTRAKTLMNKQFIDYLITETLDILPIKDLQLYLIEGNKKYGTNLQSKNKGKEQLIKEILIMMRKMLKKKKKKKKKKRKKK